jgi:peptidoglycan/LPS O-acetylase OafA/YrhL
MAVNQLGGAPGTDAKRRYFPQLEGIRGLAAVGVLITHVAFTAGQVRWTEAPGMGQDGFGLWSVLMQQIQVCLPIFFALSGMLLYRPFALAAISGTKSPRVKPYLWRRALRTLPAYWVLVIVVVIALNSQTFSGAWSVVRPLLLLQVYEDGAWPLSQGLEQTWSLATEIAFYAVLPVLAWGIGKFARRGATPVARARRILGALVPFFVIGLAFTVFSHLPFLGLWPTQGNWPLGWLDFIAAGMLLATLAAARDVTNEPVFKPFEWLSRKPFAGWVLAFACFVLVCVDPIGDPSTANYPGMAQAIYEHFFYLLFGLFIVAPLALPEGASPFITKLLTSRVVLFLGRISYGLYLWHMAVIYFWNDGSMFGASNFPLLLAEVFVTTILFATVSYYAIEKPAMKLRQRLGKAPLDPSIATIEPVRPTAPVERDRQDPPTAAAA